MKSAKEIGKDLEALRSDKPRATVANDVGISVSALQMYENGERIPRDVIKVSLAAYYGTTVGSLFFNEKEHETRTL